MNPSIHPKIVGALKTGLLLNEDQVYEMLRIGSMAFITQNYLTKVANSYTSVHLKATLEFIEKFLGNYQMAEESSNGRDIRLSYFSISEQGRDGYCIMCTPREVSFMRITSLEGLTTYRTIMTQPIAQSLG